MMNKTAALLIAAFAGMMPAAAQYPPYDFQKPSAVWELPSPLREVSGITLLETQIIAAVQDENGIIYTHDLEKQEPVRQFEFASDGDYEGIAIAGKTVYVLRSDGTLFECPDADNREDVKRYGTGIPLEDNEGLCYDKAQNQLLIGCKSIPGESSEFRGRRLIYAFDLATKKTGASPYISIDVRNVQTLAWDLGIAARGDELLKIEISDLAVHPVTGDIYVLCATDRLVIVLNRFRVPAGLRRLNPKQLHKPEGITFLPDGTLLISSEGPKNGKGIVCRFDMLK